MLTLWGRRSAFNVQKVAWLVGELGLTHRQVEVGGAFGGLDDPGARSLADRWMDWSQSSLQPDFMALFWSFYRTPAEQRDWPATRAAKARLEAHYRLLNRELSDRDHLAGPAFTLADVPAGTTLYRYFELQIDRPMLPGLAAWYRRLCRRAAYQTHVMQPFDGLLGRLNY